MGGGERGGRPAEVAGVVGSCLYGQISKYIDNPKSQVSTLEKLLTSIEKAIRKSPEDMFKIARTAVNA